MSLTISDLLKATKTIDVVISDEITFKVKYKLTYMTPAFESRYRELADGSVTQSELLEEMVDSWNVGLDNTFVKMKKTDLEKLGVIIQNSIWKAVWGDSFPNAA